MTPDEWNRRLPALQAAVDRYVRRRVSHAADAQDLAQQTLREAVEHYATLRSPEKLQAWILGIARNGVRRYFRDHTEHRWERLAAEVEARPETERQELFDEFDAVMRQVDMTGLPLPAREILTLRLCLGWSAKELATIVGVPADSIYTILSRCKRRAARREQRELRAEVFWKLMVIKDVMRAAAYLAEDLQMEPLNLLAQTFSLAKLLSLRHADNAECALVCMQLGYNLSRIAGEGFSRDFVEPDTFRRETWHAGYRRDAEAAYERLRRLPADPVTRLAADNTHALYSARTNADVPWDEIIERYEQLARLRPMDAYPVILGKAYCHTRGPRAAIAYLRDFSGSHRHHPPYLETMARLHELTREWTLARRWYKKLLAIQHAPRRRDWIRQQIALCTANIQSARS